MGFALFWALMLCLADSARAQPTSEPTPAPSKELPFKVDGRVSLHLESRDHFAYSDFSKEAQLDLETRRKGGFRAEMDLRVATHSSGLALREVFIDYKSESGNRFLLGQSKKRFGLEGEMELEERLTLGDSMVYRKLGSLSYVGRDSTIEYRRGDLDEQNLSHDLSLHSSEGLNGAALYRLRLKLDSTSQISSYSLLQMDAVTGWRISGAQGVSYAIRTDRVRIETELFFGEDYIETDFNEQLSLAQDVYFGALTAGFSYRAGDLEPFLRASALFNDLSDPGNPENRGFEGVMGSRFHVLDNFQLGTELNLVRSSTLLSRSQVVFAARYFF
jgi:hypothetical protein